MSGSFSEGASLEALNFVALVLGVGWGAVLLSVGVVFWLERRRGQR